MQEARELLKDGQKKEKALAKSHFFRLFQRRLSNQLTCQMEPFQNPLDLFRPVRPGKEPVEIRGARSKKVKRRRKFMQDAEVVSPTCCQLISVFSYQPVSHGCTHDTTFATTTTRASTCLVRD